jgi:ribosomal protein L20A (L18A)
MCYLKFSSNRKVALEKVKIVKIEKMKKQDIPLLCMMQRDSAQ